MSVMKQNESFVGSSLIKGRWKVLKKIGAGAFGEIYSGKNIITNELVAIKVERVDSKKQVLKLEVAVLKKLQACPYVCRFITCGRFNEYNYMIMELLGENISELRRRQADGKFSMGTSLKLVMQMMKALEAIHDLGYIHRDVKPSNFAMGLSGVKRHVAFIIDFGLARRYILSSGEVRPPRDATGFRGTARYASINSHLSKDLGRRDDLWSIFYMLIEFVQGQLPWRKLKDKDQIGEMKIKYNTPEIVKDLPPQFLTFMKHLKALNYGDRPDYTMLQSMFSELYHSVGCDDHTPFDWEVNGARMNPLSANSYPLGSSHGGDPEYSKDVYLSSRPTAAMNSSANNLFHHFHSSTASPSRPPTTVALGVEDDPHSHSAHSNEANNSHNPSNKSKGSAAPSDKETGSWGRNTSTKPSIKPTHPNPNQNNAGEIHIKIVDKEPVSNANPNIRQQHNNNNVLVSGSADAALGPAPITPSAAHKDASQTASTCCKKCIIM